MVSNPYASASACLEDVRDETSTIRTFVVRPDGGLPFRAGQFVELSVPGIGEAPFTPSSSPAIRERLELTVMQAGRVTRRLHALTPGARLGIRGPFGTPYPLEAFRGKEILIVGGGVGMAPLRALLLSLLETRDLFGRIILRYGAKTPADLVYRHSLLDEWGSRPDLDVRVTVDSPDDTWDGHVGVVTTILRGEFLKADPEHGVAVVCGPPVMMKFATVELLALGYGDDRIFLSMEKNMSCGIGKCGHCRVAGCYACRDGPVFPYSRVRDDPRVFD